MAKEFYDLFGLIFPNIWVEAVLHILFYICLYLISHLVLKLTKIKVLSKMSKEGKHGLIKQDISKTIYKLIKRTLQLTAAYYVLTSLPFLDQYDAVVYNACYIVGIILLTYTLVKSIDVILHFALNGSSGSAAPLLGRLSKTIIFLLALMVGMQHFNYDIWHIVTALGIGSLAVGLAAQPTLMNLIAGFNLLIDRPFHIGDRIKLSTGEIGDVVHIGLRSTQIHTTEGNMLVTPNTDLGNSRVINYCLPDSGMAFAVKFNFDQDCDFIKAKDALKNSLSDIKGISEPIKVQLTSVENGSIEISVSYKIMQFAIQSEVTDKIIEDGMLALRKSGISLSENPFKKVARI